MSLSHIDEGTTFTDNCPLSNSRVFKFIIESLFLRSVKVFIKALQADIKAYGPDIHSSPIKGSDAKIPLCFAAKETQSFEICIRFFFIFSKISMWLSEGVFAHICFCSSRTVNIFFNLKISSSLT